MILFCEIKKRNLWENIMMCIFKRRVSYVQKRLIMFKKIQNEKQSYF